MEKNSLSRTGHGGETILLVEDEPGVRRLISQMLLLTGYSVLEAANGTEAIALTEECKHTIDLLLTDIVMPFMSGGELAERLGREHPQMRILFTSGYMDDGVVREVVSIGAQFLPKPFSPDTLVRKVRQVLDEPWHGLRFRSSSAGEA